MSRYRMRSPDNTIPTSEYREVKIINKTKDVVFEDSYARSTPEIGGDIVLPPRSYCFRPRFVAKLWFGNFDKEGAEWHDEVRRLNSRYSQRFDANGKAIENPVLTAIKNGTLYVEGCTEEKSYSGSEKRTLKDLKPVFSLDVDPELEGKIREGKVKTAPADGVYSLDSTFEEAVNNTSIENLVEQDPNVQVSKLKK